MTDLLIFALLAMFAGAVVIIAILAYLYFSLKLQIEQRTEAIRREQTELAQRQALTQLQQWREQELDLARKQQLETARSEAAVQFEQWKAAYTQTIRQDAIQKSQAVTLGKITEHLVPYLPEFTYNPKDARFLGSPIDFLVFDGLSEGEVKCIIFVEVKTGTSALNTRERRIRDAVQAGKVQWLELRPQLEIGQSA
jgi:predicted Holliday junction resolvase-like endonuclease